MIDFQVTIKNYLNKNNQQHQNKKMKIKIPKINYKMQKK